MPDQRPPAILLGDARALDFLNSVATPVDVPVDWIGDGEGFLIWLEQAGLVPADALERLRERAMPGEFDAVAAQARTLREWFRRFVVRHKGRALGAGVPDELGPLNRLLERDERYSQIVPADLGGAGALRLRATRRWRSPEALLLPIGEALARFVCDEDFSHVKACEGAACTLIFADHTHGRVRRWCSMGICGNRAKQAAHRQRQKGH
jgi:predicted RNA-binding Zn ribbon-like protein